MQNEQKSHTEKNGFIKKYTYRILNSILSVFKYFLDRDIDINETYRHHTNMIMRYNRRKKHGDCMIISVKKLLVFLLVILMQVTKCIANVEKITPTAVGILELFKKFF
jgi:hypothetical protein